MDALFVLNPVAGGGRGLKAADELSASLRANGRLRGKVVITKGPKEAEEIARNASEEGWPRIVAVGGDGTLHEVVNGVMASGAPPAVLGLIPCGTGNDFARGVGLPRKVGAALDISLSAEPTWIDVGAINGRAFVNVAGFGFDAQVAQAVSDRYRGRRNGAVYLKATIGMLRNYRPVPVELVIDGEKSVRPLMMCAVGNATTYGGGMRICPRADLGDGKLDLCIVGDVTPAQTAVNLARVFLGNHLSHPKCTYQTATRIEATADREVLLHADGQMLGSLPATFSIRRRALRIALSPTHRGSDGSTSKRSKISANRRR